MNDVESTFEKQQKSPVITDAKSLYDDQHGIRLREEQPWKSLQPHND